MARTPQIKGASTGVPEGTSAPPERRVGKPRPRRRSFWDPVAIWAAISAAIGAGGLVLTKAMDTPTEVVCQAAATALGDETPNPYLTPAQQRAYIEGNLNTVRACQRDIIDG